MDMAAPERIRAMVRGTRTARKIRQPSSWERIEYSPVDRDRTSRARTASVASASARGRLDDEVVAGAGVAAEDAGVWGEGGAVVGECVMRMGERVPPEGRHPQGCQMVTSGLLRKRPRGS